MHIVADGVPFWIELKVSKSNGVNLSPHQVAWNMAYWARGGANFFLVKSLSTKHLYLFDGDQGPSLAQGGLSGSEGQRFEDLGSLFEALRPHARIFTREATDEGGSRAPRILCRFSDSFFLARCYAQRDHAPKGIAWRTL